jgi:hypothetical protein
MFKNFNDKVEKSKHKYETCQICGSTYHKAGRARHLRTRKHIDCDFINNKILDIKKVKHVSSLKKMT